MQGAGETIETFVRALYDLAEHADFIDKYSPVCYRLRGLRDEELSEKLQIQPDLTLQQAITLARQHEQVKSQLQEQRSRHSDPEVDSVRGGHYRGSRTNVHSRRGASHFHLKRERWSSWYWKRQQSSTTKQKPQQQFYMWILGKAASW